jgi:RNA polymerase sigma-70 factor, ECF subfamily
VSRLQTADHARLAGVDALVRAAQDGDRAAFGQLYDRYAGMVHSIALSAGALSDADDVVQEAFLRALRQLKSLRSPEAFGGWLGAIARNTAYDIHRRALEQTEGEDDRTVGGAQHDEMEARAALAAIRQLPKAYRETLMMRLVEGMTGPEIADRTGLSPASVRVNLHRGMKLLRTRLETATPRRRT